jgi:hypothetical protein
MDKLMQRVFKLSFLIITHQAYKSLTRMIGIHERLFPDSEVRA